MSQLADVAVFADQTVGRIAATLPGAAGIFQDHGVDFCCGGDQTSSMPRPNGRSMSIR
jgi:regulator of cell morphogenesis and NO signaling